MFLNNLFLTRVEFVVMSSCSSCWISSHLQMAVDMKSQDNLPMIHSLLLRICNFTFGSSDVRLWFHQEGLSLSCCLYAARFILY